MKHNNNLLFILVSVLVAYYCCISTSQGAPPILGCSHCSPGDQCCNDLNNNNGGPTCYNPTTHQCNNGTRLCPLNHLSCGKACYLPSQYQCNSGNRLCPLGFESCGSSCHRPYDFACINNETLVNNCVPGECYPLSCCPVNGRCYIQNVFICTNQGLFPICFGIPSNDPTVCNGQGACLGFNSCTCTEGWTGVQCTIAPP